MRKRPWGPQPLEDVATDKVTGAKEEELNQSFFRFGVSPCLIFPGGVPGRRIQGTKPQVRLDFFPTECTDLGAGGGHKGANPHTPQILLYAHTFLLGCGIHAI